MHGGMKKCLDQYKNLGKSMHCVGGNDIGISGEAALTCGEYKLRVSG